MEHSFLPPSGASAWTRCALWPTMNARFPQDDSAESVEGTAAHWVAWELLAGRPVSEGASTDKGVIVTGEMIEAAEIVIQVIFERIIQRGMTPIVEKRVSVTAVHRSCFGTPDIWAFHKGNMHLEVIDYKYGHRFVDEFQNQQTNLYVLGILEEIASNLIGDPGVISVSVTIVQPRCFYRGIPVRTHNFKMQQAIDSIPLLQEFARGAYMEQPVAMTGEHCRDCPGRHACNALQQAAYSDAEFSNNRPPHDLSPAAAGLELKMLQHALTRLQARVEGLQELTLANLKRGEVVPYFRLESGKPRKQWNVPVEQVVSLGKLFGKDLSKPGVITPLQAEKNGIDAAVINSYSVTPSGSVKLVPENPSDARRVFGLI